MAAIDLETAARLPPRPKVALRLGVSGHRSRPGRALDAQRVRGACADLFHRVSPFLVAAKGGVYADAKPTLTLVTALAEGSDQLAAQAFDAGDHAEVRRRLEVVLPFPIDDYAATFSDAAAAQAMRDRAATADATFVLADWRPPGGDQPSALAAHRRDRRYATQGDLVVRQVDILLAVWDRQPALGLGGTAEVVATAVAQGVPVILIDPATGDAQLLKDAPRFGDLFAIVDGFAVPLDDKALEDLVSALIAPPKEDEPDAYTSLDAFLEREPIPTRTGWAFYQKLMVGPAQRALAKAAAREAAKAGARPKPTGSKATPERWSIGVDHVAQTLAGSDWSTLPAEGAAHAALRGDFSSAWAATDAISTKLGHVYRSTYLLIFILGPVAVLTGLLGLVWEKAEWAFALAELMMLGLGTLLFRMGRRRGHHLRWLRGRELAEQFRAHWGLAMTGLGGRRPLGVGATWNAWLFNAYTAALGVPNLTATPAALGTIARRIQDDVVRNQMSYHAGNSAKLGKIHHRLERAGFLTFFTALLLGAILVATALPWSGLTSGSWHALVLRLEKVHCLEEIMHVVRLVLTISCAVLPMAGAALAGLRFQGDFERFADRSHETSQALKRIDEALDAFTARPLTETPLGSDEAPLFETLQAIFTDLERVLLSDLEDWRFVYRARPSPEPG